MRHLVTSWLLASSLLFFPPAQAALALPTNDRLELRVKLEPAAQKLEVDGNLAIQVRRAGTRELTWLLDRRLEITELKGPLVADWTFTREPPSQEPGLLKIRFLRPMGPADRVKFRIRYHGNLAKGPASTALRPWTQLSRALPWFPLRADNAAFTFRLEVQCKPQYALASFGPFQEGAGSRTLVWNQPVTDLVLVAAPRERLQIWNPATGVRFVSTGLGAEETSRLAIAMGRLMATLQRRLGPREAATMTLIQSLRPEDSLSARPGLVILGGLNYAQVKDGLGDILQMLAVETAHVWWCSAPTDTWEDWLNESFAEHSALLAIREVLGEPDYQRAIELKRRACEGLPPLWAFDRQGPNAKSIMENKGVILLAELEGFVGRQRFEKFCRELATRKLGQTAKVLDLLEATEGKSVREAFQRRLMTL